MCRLLESRGFAALIRNRMIILLSNFCTCYSCFSGVCGVEYAKRRGRSESLFTPSLFALVQRFLIHAPSFCNTVESSSYPILHIIFFRNCTWQLLLFECTVLRLPLLWRCVHFCILSIFVRLLVSSAVEYCYMKE